jgi:glutamine synthetase
LAASFAAGLYGIQNKLPLSANPVSGDAYKGTAKLPRNLWEASQRMGSSKLARELFGDAFVDHFVATREWEWRQFMKAVTNWEIERYFEII